MFCCGRVITCKTTRVRIQSSATFTELLTVQKTKKGREWIILNICFHIENAPNQVGSDVGSKLYRLRIDKNRIILYEAHRLVNIILLHRRRLNKRSIFSFYLSFPVYSYSLCLSYARMSLRSSVRYVSCFPPLLCQQNFY